jgi:hypothetical protein
MSDLGKRLAEAMDVAATAKPCKSNIAEHDPIFEPAQCIEKGPHAVHKGAHGQTWTDPPKAHRGYLEEFPDPEPDDLPREQLAEHSEMWAAVAQTLDEWLGRMHGIYAGRHNAGAFLDFLAMQGYRVTPIEKPPPISELLPPATD